MFRPNRNWSVNLVAVTVLAVPTALALCAFNQKPVIRPYTFGVEFAPDTTLYDVAKVFEQFQNEPAFRVELVSWRSHRYRLSLTCDQKAVLKRLRSETVVRSAEVLYPQKVPPSAGRHTESEAP